MNRISATIQAPHVRSGSQPVQGEKNGPFYLVMLALLFEFGRPQYVIPGLKGLPIASVIDVLIILYLFGSGKVNLRNSQSKLWLAMFGLMIVHVPIAVNNYWALITFKDMAFNFILYLGVVTYVSTVARWRTLISLWFGIHVTLSVLGILSGGTGVGGWLGDENDFCMAINMVVPFAFFMMNAAPTVKAKNVYVGLLLVFIMTIMATMSRGGFIGFLAAGVYCWKKAARKIGALAVTIIIVIVMALFAPAKYWDEIQSSFSDETIEHGTGEDRLYIWGIGFEMFLGNPIIGVGQGNFPWVFEEYEAGRTRDGKSRAGRQAHSLYFTLLPELGLVGTFLFCGMIWNNYKDARYIERTVHNLGSGNDNPFGDKNDGMFLISLARAIEGSLFAYLITSVFISTIWYPCFWIMMAFMVALRNLVRSLVEDAAMSIVQNGKERLIQ